MTRKEKIYLKLQRCFEEQILREIYVSDNVSLCNVGNAYYAAFLIGEEIKSDDIQFMLINDEQIEYVMQDDKNLSNLYNARPADKKMVYKFNERAYNTMKNSRNRTLIEGPQVDLIREQELIEKYGSKNKSK